MGTRILKIDEEMPEINECKVGNPQISISRNWANLSQPWILTFFEDEIFKPFFFNFMSQKYQNEKSPIVYDVKSSKHWEKSKKWLCYKPEKFTRCFETPCRSRYLHQDHHTIMNTSVTWVREPVLAALIIWYWEIRRHISLF